MAKSFLHTFILLTHRFTRQGLRVLLVLCLAGQAMANDLPDPMASWPESCNHVRQELESHPGIDVRFSPRPEEPLQQGSYWSLEWNDITIPVPAADYNKLVVGEQGVSDDWEMDSMVLLVAPDGHMLALHTMGGFAPVEDVFATTNLASGTKTTSEVGTQLTKEVWGGPVGLARHIAEGYAVAPGDLTCAPENWRREIRSQVGLILKRTHRGVLDSAYRLPELGEYAKLSGSILEDEDTYLWRTLLPPPAGGDDIAQIELSIPLDSPTIHAGLGIARPETFTSTTPPDWFNHLQTVLENGSTENFQALLLAVEQAGFDEATVERLAEAME